MVNCINLIIEMSPHFILGRENVPCVAEVVNRSLKADCTDFTLRNSQLYMLNFAKLKKESLLKMTWKLNPRFQGHRLESEKEF